MPNFDLPWDTGVPFSGPPRDRGISNIGLQIMLDFFEANRFTLFESLGSNLSTLEKGMKARINTVVAILKDIEKTQTKPTHEMIQLLFTEKPSRKEILVEKKPPLLERNLKRKDSLIKRTDTNDE